VIIYDLKCENGHKFEGWFHDRNAFEEQKGQQLISCPICGSTDAELMPIFTFKIVNNHNILPILHENTPPPCIPPPLETVS